MSKELNIIEAMNMPLGTEFIIKYNDGNKRKVELVEVNEIGNNNVLLKYLDAIDKTKNYYVDLHRDLVFAKFIPIQKPVSFIEAVKSGKRVKVKHKLMSEIEETELKEFEFISWILFAITKENIDVKEIIINGKWYIEEDDEE